MTAVTINFSGEDLLKDARKAALGILAFVAICMVAHCGSGCKPLQSAADVDAAYAAEIRQCSLSAKTKAEAKACRVLVNTKYGLCNEPWPAVTPCDE